MDNQKLSLLVNYHLREGFVSKLQDTCAAALATRTNDHAALLWRAVGLTMESRTAEVQLFVVKQCCALCSFVPTHALRSLTVLHRL